MPDTQALKMVEAAGVETSGVVMRRIRNAELARSVDQGVPRKGMSKRRMIVLALGGEVERAVFPRRK